jgi:hypothetical protein
MQNEICVCASVKPDNTGFDMTSLKIGNTLIPNAFVGNSLTTEQTVTSQINEAMKNINPVNAIVTPEPSIPPPELKTDNAQTNLDNAANAEAEGQVKPAKMKPVIDENSQNETDVIQQTQGGRTRPRATRRSHTKQIHTKSSRRSKSLRNRKQTHKRRVARR